MAKEIAEEYASSLADLTVNSKPLINMLTILAEENIDHAGVIVDTVEKHLEKVPPEIKLPVLYLVDSIIKNVGGAYTQKFSQSIVNMFTSTFKKVDEKIRAQMFKLRETWHDVFPATKLYQLDVKVNLIDPAWPIQAQPQQSNIHQTGGPSNNVVSQLTEEEEKMRAILAKKEQELLMLQRKKIEMELEQTRRQLELAEKSAKLPTPVIGSNIPSTSMPVAMVNPVMASVPVLPPEVHVPLNVPVKQRLGPPVARSSRIAPVSAALATARRDPRLARQQQQQQRQQQQPRQQQPPRQQQQPPPPPRIAPNVFDIQPLERPPKRHAVLTIDVPQPRPPRDPRIRRKKDDLDREKTTDNYIEKLLDQKKVKLPPIPKINRDKADGKTSPLAASPLKKRKDALKDKAKKRDGSKDSSSSSSPEKKHRKERDPKKDKADKKPKLDKKDPRDKGDPEVVQFKELKNFNKDRYRRNRDKSDSPEPTHKEVDLPGEASNAPEIVESKDVDLRVLPSVELKPALIAQKRSSTEAIEGKSKKSKVDKFDILFGSEDVDLRQLPQVEEAVPAPPVIVEPPQDSSTTKSAEASPKKIPTPEVSPNTKDWHEVKEKEVKKTPSKLDIVRAKLAEATKGKDRLGRPLLFTKSPSVEKEREERRRSISQSGDIEDTDMRHENGEEFDAEDHKKTISIIMSQAKEQFKDGQLDKNQYNTLMYQVLQLNEKLKLKEAKQRESLEISKRKLKAQIEEDSKGKKNTLKGPDNNFGDIDERINPPPAFIDIPIDKQGLFKEDSDMRISNGPPKDGVDGLNKPPFMRGPLVAPPMFQPRPNMPGFNPSWRGHRPRVDEYVPRNRFRGPGPNPPFFRGKFNPRGPRPPYDPSMPIPLPTPQMGTCQGPCPLIPYERSSSPPPLGAPGVVIPPTDFSIIEYIDQDPVKTIQIDGIHREIRFYGETAIIMLDWDDPREIKFLPGCRRVTFDNKDSVVLSFNEGYKQVEIDDQVFDIRFGAPTRELYINGRWHECFFGGAPFGVIIDGKPHLVQLEGPLPQVDIGKEKRMDLVAGKLNLIVNATQMCPVYLDAKVQKFVVNGNVFTIRFVDALRTVLINEQPFAVKYGDLPEPIYCGSEKYFIRFSALPRNVKPGLVQITNMEGSCLPLKPVIPFENIHIQNLEVDQEDTVPRPDKTPSPDGESKGLDMLASLMPSNLPTAPASASEYSLAEPLFVKPESIPGLDTSVDEKQTNETTKPVLPILGDLNVTDLFAKLVATGIVQVPPVKNEVNKETPKDENKELETPKEDKTVVHHVDLLRPETLRVKQPGLVSRLYGGMQCGECGARFPPERTVRYSQHLDWHFRRNRRRRAPARAHWHYDLPDWLQYVELPDADHREKSWFDTDGSEAAPHEAGPAEAPSVPAGAPLDCSCALCGDTFHQFYNEDREEWHLRNSTRYEDKNYHPDCLEEYKASLTKEKAEPAPLEENNDVITLDKTEEAIEIADFNNDSDNESVVEVTADLELPSEPVEIDEDGDEDDVVLKAEPVEQVTVDDNDTDDETAAERSSRDQQYHVDLSRVKTEPQDNDDDMPVITEEEQVLQPTIETSHNTVLSSIDGNVQFESTPAQTLSLGGIRINISKPLQPIPTVVSDNSDKTYDDISLEDEPLPPGEEPELDFKLKPTLEGIHFRRQPPIKKGNELSGLCSVM